MFKVNRVKTLVFAVTVLASTLVLTPPSFADDDCTQVCEQTFTDAQKLPSPNADSIKSYLNQLVDDANQCLQCAANQIQGQPAPDNGQPGGSSSSSSSSSSSGGSSSGSSSSSGGEGWSQAD